MINKHASKYDTYESLLKGDRARALAQYDELRQRAKEVISAKRQKVVELEAENQRLREALNIICTANPMNTYVCEIADKALTGEGGE